ncbi:BtpA/SgcQ family protein [Jannaschia sp. 2305UL9-9]|uniref:BtpA/SgcQ family protein n=1 Tax=Jannaschia sp. 2305UL9-9 TaxID=3121638 RepID=UPI003528A03F
MLKNRIIGALQIPSFGHGAARSMAWYEDFVLSNARSYVENGITAIKLQDETVEAGPAQARTLARTATLGAAMRREFPDLELGIIVEAHDPVAAIAVADACDAAFVRLKIFVGAMVNSGGTREALGPEAIAFRNRIGREDIQILADVHDRTAVPLTDVPNEMAAHWASRLGADALVITGSSFDDTLDRIARARDMGIKTPTVIGGSVTAANVTRALSAADMIVVSSALLRDGAADDAMDRWDPTKIRRFMEAANQ